MAGNDTLEILAYDGAGNSTYDSMTISAADSPMPVILSLDITDVTDTSAIATVTTESNIGLSYEWFIQDPDGQWSKFSGDKSSVTLYNLKRHSDYTVRVVVYNESGNSVTATASFTTESMGELYEGNSSWMIYTAIALLVVFGIVVLLFALILRGGRKKKQPAPTAQKRAPQNRGAANGSAVKRAPSGSTAVKRAPSSNGSAAKKTPSGNTSPKKKA